MGTRLRIVRVCGAMMHGCMEAPFPDGDVTRQTMSWWILPKPLSFQAHIPLPGSLGLHPSMCAPVKSKVKLETIRSRLAWSLRKDDMVTLTIVFFFPEGDVIRQTASR